MEVNNTFSPIDIATSGLRAHSKQIEVISSNVANARTTVGLMQNLKQRTMRSGALIWTRFFRI
ncbi:MAG: flagellar basal body protein [Planctomycetota bacterium]|jgi:flagellar basal body rod protein FlgC